MFSLRYLVTIGGSVVDARTGVLLKTEHVNAVLTSAKLHSITGQLYQAVLTTLPKTASPATAPSKPVSAGAVLAVRKAQCAAVTVEGRFSVADVKPLTKAVEGVLGECMQLP